VTCISSTTKKTFSRF